MVVHGGDNGELLIPQNESKGYAEDEEATIHNPKYIFQENLDLVQAVDVGEGETIPTLRAVLELLSQSDLYKNIELKTPFDGEL